MALLKRKRSGLNDPMSVVTRFVNACNRHDADGVASCLHPDFDSIQPMYPTRNFRGADQVRRNWQAIFDAEPGFRLTVLRSAAVDDTIWLELHGAGEEAEVAGVFVMGILGDRIRWARIYSALVEPVPEGVGEPPAPLREVPRHDGAGAPAGDGEVVEEALIAPVLDMDRGSRRRRRRRGGDDDDQPVEVEPQVEAAAEPEEALAADAEAVVMVDGATQTDTVVVADPEAEVVETVVVAEPDAEVVVEAGPEADVVVVTDDAAEAEPETAVVVIAPAEEEDDDDGGPPTEAVDVIIDTEPEAEDEPVVTEDPDDDGTRRGLFGRKKP